MRQEILTAALAAYSEKGDAATVEDVRRGSGASVGSIYHWFGASAASPPPSTWRPCGTTSAATSRCCGGRPDAERGVRGLVRHHLRWVAANPDLARLLLTGRESGGEEVRELNREVFRATEAWLSPHVKEGRIRRMPLDLYYTVLIGPSQEFARHWLAGRTKSSITKAERTLGDAAWHALRAGEEPK